MTACDSAPWEEFEAERETFTAGGNECEHGYSEGCPDCDVPAWLPAVLDLPDARPECLAYKVGRHSVRVDRMGDDHA